jgi:uncharacterized protein
MVLHLFLKFLYNRQKYVTKTITVNGRKFDALIADTSTKKMIGLMFRKSLKKNQCMLFIFEESGFHAIWMYSMLFAIDVIWLNSKSKIVDIEEDLKPCGSMFGCKEYVPKERAKFVLEFTSGTVKNLKITKKSAINLSS